MSAVLLAQGDAGSLPLRDGSVHCCVTSPPYWGLRSYGIGAAQGELGCEALHDCAGAWTGTPCGACYVCHLRQAMREVWRVLRDDGTLWLVLGDSYANDCKWGGTTGGKHVKALHGASIGRRKRQTGLKPKNLVGIPWRVALALQADGWTLRSAITWCKTAPMPESVRDRPTSATEMVFLLVKHPQYFYGALAVAEPSTEAGRHGLGHFPEGHTTHSLRNFWVLNPEPYAGAHYATMPTALVERCIKAGSSEAGCCGACGAPSMPQREAGAYAPSCGCDAGLPVPCTVLDPFCGSGTVPLVARALGRHGVGMDLSLDYLKNQARNRLQLDALAAWEGEPPRRPPTEDWSALPLFGAIQEETSHGTAHP